MAKEIDADLLQKQRDSLVQDLTNAKVAVETSNRVQQILGAIQMTDNLIAVSKEGNYSKSRANSEQENPENATEVQKSLEEHAKDMVSELGDDNLGKVD
jgi:HKD family nuclease